LTENVSDHRVNLLNMALSSKPGTLEIQECEDNPYVSSVYDVTEYNANASVRKISVPTSTGDVKISELGLERITILKIDAEGHDFDVLAGFQKAISNGTIDFIQFEYNVFTLLAKRSLREFHHLLSKGYVLGRLLPHGIEVCGYHFIIDNFGQSNWVAIRKNLIDEKFIKNFNLSIMEGLAGIALKSDVEDLPDIKSLLRL